MNKMERQEEDSQGRIIRSGSWFGVDSEAEADRILGEAMIADGSDEREEKSGGDYSKPQYSEGLIGVCQAYEQKFGTPRSVFYPGCGIDASPLRGFPNSEVVFLDPDEASARVMRDAGISILEKGIEDYSGKHDLILLLNPHFNSVLALNNLKRNGRIIANNYFGAPAARPLEEYGLPILARLDVRERKVIELPLDSKPVSEHYYVFGGMKTNLSQGSRKH